MNFLLLIVFFACSCLGYFSLADVLLPTTLAQCQACCDIVAFRSEFDSFSFSTSVCKSDGCNRLVSLNNLLCSDLYSLNTNNRRGCELGRDFRFNGYTSLLTSATDLRRCPSLPGEEHFLTDQLLIPHTLPEVVTPFAITRADCSDCCEELRVERDNGENGNPDDFETESCQNTCTDNPVVPCFAENSHNTRSGCLLAMDFLLQGRGTLDVTRGAFTCDATGGALISGTSFPTLFPTTSPTKNPTKKPTFAPTKSPHAEPTTAPTKLPTVTPTESPHAEPTTAPTKLPTVTPTVSPTRSPTDKSSSPTKSPIFNPTGSPIVPTILADPSQPNTPQSPSTTIRYAVVGTGGFGVLLFCCLVALIQGRRTSIRRNRDQTLKRTFGEENEYKPGVASNTRPVVVSPPKSEFAPPGMGFRPSSLANDSATPKIAFPLDANYEDGVLRGQIEGLPFGGGHNTLDRPEGVEVDEFELDPMLNLGPKAKNLRPYFENAGDVGFTFGRKVVEQSKTPIVNMDILDGEPSPSSVMPRMGGRNAGVYENTRSPSIMRLVEEEGNHGNPKPRISF